MARRIGDPALLWWASHTAWKALWTPARATRRLALAREGLEAARAAGDPDSEAVALVVLAASALEMGDRATYEETARETERLARRRRNAYALMALAWVDLSLASMRGDARRRWTGWAELYELRPRLNPDDGGPAPGRHPADLRACGPTAIGELIEPIAAANAAAGNDLARDVLLLALARDQRRRPAARGALRARSSTGWTTGAARPPGAAAPRRRRSPATGARRADGRAAHPPGRTDRRQRHLERRWARSTATSRSPSPPRA